MSIICATYIWLYKFNIKKTDYACNPVCVHKRWYTYHTESDLHATYHPRAGILPRYITHDFRLIIVIYWAFKLLSPYNVFSISLGWYLLTIFQNRPDPVQSCIFIHPVSFRDHVLRNDIRSFIYIWQLPSTFLPPSTWYVLRSAQGSLIHQRWDRGCLLILFILIFKRRRGRPFVHHIAIWQNTFTSFVQQNYI